MRRSTKRFAEPDSDAIRSVARVPVRSGVTRSSSMRSSSSAWPSGVSSRSSTMPDGAAGDLDDVALDHRGGGLEADLDAVGVVAAEQDQGDDPEDEQQ